MNLSIKLSGIFFVLFPFFLLSCDGDELDGLAPDSFSVDKNDYRLSQGVLIDYGQHADGGGHDYDIFLASDDIRLQSGDEADFLGKGNAVYLDLSTWSEHGLGIGDYTWDNSDNNSFVEGLVYLDFDFGSEMNEAIIAEKGMVSIDSREEGGYRIKFVMQLGDGKIVKGAYDGFLTEVKG